MPWSALKIIRCYVQLSKRNSVMFIHLLLSMFLTESSKKLFYRFYKSIFFAFSSSLKTRAFILSHFLWNHSKTSWWRTTETSLGVSFETCLRRREDVPLRRLGDVPLRRHWVFHLRLVWDVVKTYHWGVLATFHWDVIGCFIWDVPAASLGRKGRRHYDVATTSCCRVG